MKLDGFVNNRDGLMTNLIQKLTKGCTGDCAISVVSNISTCTGYTPIYNKEGTLISEDSNVHTTSYKCHYCSKSWDISQKGNHITITPPLD
jgi:hypothetical protein